MDAEGPDDRMLPVGIVALNGRSGTHRPHPRVSRRPGVGHSHGRRGVARSPLTVAFGRGDDYGRFDISNCSNLKFVGISRTYMIKAKRGRLLGTWSERPICNFCRF
jgi:hypothetical protein